MNESNTFCVQCGSSLTGKSFGLSYMPELAGCGSVGAPQALQAGWLNSDQWLRQTRPVSDLFIQVKTIAHSAVVHR